MPLSPTTEGSSPQTRFCKGRSFRARGRAGATPAAGSLSPGGRAGSPPPLRGWGRGPCGGGGRRSRFSGSSLWPPALGPRPQTPKCFTRHPKDSPSDLARQRLDGPGNSASTTVVQGLGPTLRGDDGGGHQKAFGLLGKESPTPVQPLTCPGQPKHRPLPLPRLPRGRARPAPAGACGYLEGWLCSRERK